jgi:hypothetical protein
MSSVTPANPSGFRSRFAAWATDDGPDTPPPDTPVLGHLLLAEADATRATRAEWLAQLPQLRR